MADKVPDTENFNIRDVQDVVSGNDLQVMFSNAVLAGFDGNYDDYVKGSGVRDSLYNFRNYQIPSTTTTGYAYAYYGPKTAPYSANTLAWQWGTNFQAVHDISVGELDSVTREYFRCTSEIVSGALVSTHINRVNLRFDLTGIPPGSSIVSAVLKTWIYASYGTEYSFANGYGEIFLQESNPWAFVSGALYGSIKKESSGLWRAPMFNGASSAYDPGGSALNIRQTYALPSDFSRIENYFGANLYATLVTRQDRYVIPPSIGQILGLHIFAPSGDSVDYFRKLETVYIKIEYTP